jgi:hypothetical protein
MGLVLPSTDVPPGPNNQVGEYQGLIWHSFVSSPRVPGIVEDYGSDSNSSPYLIAHTSFDPTCRDKKS